MGNFEAYLNLNLGERLPPQHENTNFSPERLMRIHNIGRPQC